MQIAFLRTVLIPWLAGALLAGCGGGGSSGTNPAAAVPAAVGHQAAGPAPRKGVRRTAAASSCSGAGTDSFVGGGHGNVAGATYTGVLEGDSNTICDENGAIGAGMYNFISSGGDTAFNSFIGAGDSDSITGSAFGSVIGGGLQNAVSGEGVSFIGAGAYNTIAGSAYGSVIGGGSQNAVSASVSSIAGGNQNTIGSAEYAFVGGGSGNSITAQNYGFIGSGLNNKITAEGATVGGGYDNLVEGAWGTTPGGYANTVTGAYSFAAGVRSYAATSGTFVWSDALSGATQLKSTVANSFLARATGGVTFWTNSTNTVGAKLAAGSGTWASASDRAMKTNVARVDDADVLDKVARLPISRWSYVSERGVRHVGPMAQDFYAAFRVGEDDKHITSIDEDGVALSAIKALHAENAALRARQRALEREVQELSDAVASLRER